MFIATKSFPTKFRRFQVGDTIAPVDCDSMAQFERFQEMGLIGEAPPETQAPAPVAAPAADTVEHV